MSQTNCKVCGEWCENILYPRKDYEIDGYCSVYCGIKAGEKYCKFCGERYNDNFDWNKDGYCNRECAIRGHWGVAYCENCNKRIERSFGYKVVHERVYCYTCGVEKKKKQDAEKAKHDFDYAKFKCDWCGKSYYRKDSNALKDKTRFCSRKCEVEYK